MEKPELELSGTDGNAFAILAKAKRAFSGVQGITWDKFYKEATSGDYSHLLVTVYQYFEVL